MLKLKRYLKPFILGSVIALILLFTQAILDLNLPNYMSDIVNVGIQQKGIEKAAPEAISETGYLFMTSFMSDEEKLLMNDSYTLKDFDEKNYSKLYPNVKNRLYVLNNDVSEDDLEIIDNAFGVSTWTVINVMKTLLAPSEQTLNNSMDMDAIKLDKMYQLLPIVNTLPKNVIEEARKKALTMDEMILKQSGTVMTGAFYKELGIDMSEYQRDYILHVGLLMLLISIGSGLATILVNLISSKVAAGVARNLRNDIFKKVQSFSNTEYDRFSTASLITRSTNDVTQIQMFITMGIRMLCYAPIMAVGAIIMALDKSVSMSWVIALSVIILIMLIIIVFIIAVPKFKLMQKLVDRLNLVARETLNGLMVIRAFGKSDFEKKRFDKANKDLAKTNLFVNRIMTFIWPAMNLIMNGVMILIIWVGAHQVAKSTMQIGDMMAFMQYALHVIFSFLMIAMMFIFIPRASVSATRIAQVLNTKPVIKDPKKPKQIDEKKKGYVEFKNVSFRYEKAEKDVLHNISFVAKPGETVAFIGATGSGKSTIINLIPRFYDVTMGEVLVDGVNVKDLTQKELRSRIGYIPQESILMSGTIKSNIKYGNDNLSNEEVEEVAKVAQALDFIKEKEKGFNTEIAQGGSNVSGGQRQRLAIARALAVKPDIFIFDDSFSALDFKTDLALRKALKEYTKDSTVIIIAQRVGTIMNVDRIYVIDNGKIIGHGTHKELLKKCKEYYEIASSQLSKEELAYE